MISKNIYKRIIISILTITFVVSNIFVLISKTNAAFNRQINYQGKLTDASNIAVADGLYAIEFKLYTTSTGGSPIWTETDSGANKIQVTNGLFSVMLGSTTPFTGVDFNQTLYLGVKVESDSEMTPRKVIGAVPAAFVADTLNGVSSNQFLRNDTQNATSSTETFVNILQSGAGKIAEFFGQGSNSVLALLSNGNVGIGTTSPIAKLTVIGDGYFAGNITATGTLAVTSTTTTGGLSVGSLSGLLWGTNGAVSAVSTSSLGLASSASLSALTSGLSLDHLSRWNGSALIDSIFHDNGTVTGINATSSSYTFNVQGTSGVNPFNIASSTGASLLTVLNNGNVGIGTTSPVAKLSVTGSGLTTGKAFSITDSAFSEKFTVLDNGEITTPLNVTNSSSTIATINVTTPNVADAPWIKFMVPGLDVATIRNNNGFNFVSLVSGLDNKFVTNGGQFTVFDNSVELLSVDDVDTLSLSGGDGASVFSNATMRFGYDNTFQYPQWIHTRHNNSATNNAFDFYTSDGTANGVFPTNAIHGMTITNGNVGIGSTSPISKLVVIDSSTSDNNPPAQFINADGLTDSSNYQDGTLFGQGSGYQNMNLSLWTDNTNFKSFIQSVRLGYQYKDLLLNAGGGNVGIGQTSPASPLDVSGFSAVTESTGRFYNSTGRTNLIIKGGATQGGNNLLSIVGADDSNRLTVYGNGSAVLAGDLYEGSYGDYRFIAYNSFSNSGGLSSIDGGGFTFGKGGTYSAITGGGGGYLSNERIINFFTGNDLTNEKMIIRASGNVGIGSSTPSSKLTVIGDAWIGGNITATGTLAVTSTTTTGGLSVGSLSGLLWGTNGAVSAVSTSSLGLLGSSNIAVGTQGWIPFYNASTNVLSATSSIFIAQNGNVGIGTTSPLAKLSIVGDSFFTATTTLDYLKNSPSFLAVNASGQIIATTTPSGGSGTVNSGLLGQMSFYSANGTAVSGTSTLIALNEKIGIGTDFSVSSSGNDDFTSDTLDGSWTFVEPPDASDYSLTNTADHLEISIPSGSTHDCYGGTTSCVRMTKTATNGDFTIETKIDGTNLSDSGYGNYGIWVEQDTSNYLRFEFLSNGGGSFTAEAHKTIGGSGTAHVITASHTFSTSNYLKVTRSGNSWTLEKSTDGSSWSTVGSFSQALTVAKIGLHVGNAVANPAVTGKFDYFYYSSGNVDTFAKLNVFTTEALTQPNSNPSLGYGTASAGKFVSSDSDAPTILVRNTSTSPCIGQYTGCSTAVVAGGEGILTIEGNDSTNTTRYNLLTAYNSNTRASSTSVFNVRADGSIYSAGNVGIGSTSPAYKLSVYRTGDGPVASFTDSNGTCTIDPTSTSLACSSDERLKKDITAFSGDDVREKLFKLQGVNYRWKNQISENLHFGYIAQEVEKVFPEFVLTDSAGMKSVAYTSFIPVITESIKTLDTNISSTTLAMKELNSKVEDLSINKLASTTTVYMNQVAPEIDLSTIASTTAETLVNSKTFTNDLSDKIASTTITTIENSESFISKIANSVKMLLSTASDWVVGKLSASYVYTKKIETETIAISQGLEMKDQDSGQIYCVTIKSGNWDKRVGSCSEISQSTTTPIVMSTTTPVITPIPTPSPFPEPIPTPISTTTLISTTTPIITPTSTDDIIPVPEPAIVIASTTETVITPNPDNTPNPTPIPEPEVFKESLTTEETPTPEPSTVAPSVVDTPPVVSTPNVEVSTVDNS